MDQLLMQNMLPQPTAPMHSSSQSHSFDMFMNFFAEDIKLALLVLVVVIASHFIPISAVLGRYIALDKIPYHDVLLRSVLAAVIVIVIRKFFIK
jgi:hypothetical protein